MSDDVTSPMCEDGRMKPSGHRITAHRPSKTIKRLALRCDGGRGRFHDTSAPMEFVGYALTKHGRKCAEFQCCVAGCPVAELWVFNRETGRPEKIPRLRPKANPFGTALRWILSLARMIH